MEKTVKVGVGPKDSPEVQVSAAEFILEGLHAHKRIGRNEERVFTAGENSRSRLKNLLSGKICLFEGADLITSLVVGLQSSANRIGLLTT